LEEFFSVIKRFGINIKEEDKQNLIDALPGKDDGQRKRLNISKLFDQKYNK